MTIFDVGDLVWVPFPFAELPRLRARPALIVSRPWQADGFRLYWSMMVTSEDNAGWPDDILIGEAYAEIGLPSPSIIRPAKIASIMEASARPLGRLSASLIARVRDVIASTIAIDGWNEAPY